MDTPEGNQLHVRPLGPSLLSPIDGPELFASTENHQLVNQTICLPTKHFVCQPNTLFAPKNTLLGKEALGQCCNLVVMPAAGTMPEVPELGGTLHVSCDL